jgi:hypothetical protein
MADVAMHPLAPHHLPAFITAPGETDVFFTGMVVFVAMAVMVLGSLYFWLHSLPEHIAHGASKVQFQLVAVLALLALFTHQNAFWVAALVLALVPIPDLWTPLASMAESLARMAGLGRRDATAAVVHPATPEPAAASAPPRDIAIVAPMPTPPVPVGSKPPGEAAAVAPAPAPSNGGQTGAPALAGAAPAAGVEPAKRRALPTEGA